MRPLPQRARRRRDGEGGVLQRFIRATGRLADTTMILDEARDPATDRRSLDVLVVFSEQVTVPAGRRGVLSSSGTCTSAPLEEAKGEPGQSVAVVLKMYCNL